MNGEIEHGTYAGAMRHQYLKIPKCAACKKAAADYKRAWWRKTRCAPGLGWPLDPPVRA